MKFWKGEKENKVTDVKKYLTGKNILCKNSTEKRRNHISRRYRFIASQPWKAPKLSQSREGNTAHESYHLDYQTQLQKIQKKTKNTHTKLCTRFCIKSRLVRSHECHRGLWLQGSAFSLQQISLGFL